MGQRWRGMCTLCRGQATLLLNNISNRIYLSLRFTLLHHLASLGLKGFLQCYPRHSINFMPWISKKKKRKCHILNFYLS